ncbi:MAG: PorV/PorQ family protein [Elusimicrobiales bacterium]
MNAKTRLNIGAIAAARTAAAACLLALCPFPDGALAAGGKATPFTTSAAGTTSADFLNLPVGARASAMGGAYSAISEEASAIYWNPAGLVQIPKLSAVFMRTQYVQDISYQYAAYAHRVSYDSVLAGSVFLTDIGSIDRTDIDGSKIGTFSPRDQVFTLSYSKAVLEFSDKDMDVSVGVSMKYIRSQIIDSAKSYAGDLGIMTYNFTNIPYRLGVTMNNMGAGMRYDAQSCPLPLTFKLAGAVNPFKNMLFSMDMVFPKQNKPSFLLGTELSTEPNELTRLSVRAGLNTQRLKDGLSGFTLGVGATLHFFTLDYAFVPMGELGSTHKISITFDLPFRTPVFSRREHSIFSKQNAPR